MASQIKTLGKSSEREIQLCILKSLNPEQRKLLQKGLEAVCDTLSELNDYSTTKENSPVKVPSAKEQFEKNFIPKLIENLNQYELNEEEIIKTQVDFSFKKNYSLSNNDEKKIIHGKMKVGDVINKIQNILLKRERGLLYLSCLDNLNEESAAMYFFKTFNVSKQRVYELMKLCLLISQYPRLIVLGVRYDELVRYYTRLISEFKTNIELRERLQRPVTFDLSHGLLTINSADIGLEDKCTIKHMVECYKKLPSFETFESIMDDILFNDISVK